MTPYEGLAGRPYEGQLAEFGESLMVLANRESRQESRSDLVERSVLRKDRQQSLYHLAHGWNQN